MAIARLQFPSARPTPQGESLSDEVELYQRTYSTLLRSSGETRLRVLEPSHRAIRSSLHPLAARDALDLGAFLYAIRRLPAGIVRARRIVMGQDPALFARAGVGPLEDWEPVEAPARRRRWYDSGGDTLAVLLARASDVDDLVPTLVALQIEWNKLNQRLRTAEWPDDQEPEPEDLAAALGGTVDDWARLRGTWGEAFMPQLREIGERRMSLRVRMLGGTQVGYARITRRWWAPVRACLAARRLEDRPIYFVSSNTHSLANLVTGLARGREVAVDTSALRAVYVLGKAATLNADVGDVMISSVVHDEHSGTTYWLDNAFGVEDIEPDLRFGTGLDNQRAVTVKSTFLQNRSYLDFYYREQFTVVEMEAGPYCNAVYEIADAERYPVGEAVNFSKLPLDFGVIHYASDTPYTQARTLGARGLSYYGMDSTYAASLAILRRVLRLEGALR